MVSDSLLLGRVSGTLNAPAPMAGWGDHWAFQATTLSLNLIMVSKYYLTRRLLPLRPCSLGIPRQRASRQALSSEAICKHHKTMRIDNKATRCHSLTTHLLLLQNTHMRILGASQKKFQEARIQHIDTSRVGCLNDNFDDGGGRRTWEANTWPLHPAFTIF